jgi:hypothetical protein
VIDDRWPIERVASHPLIAVRGVLDHGLVVAGLQCTPCESLWALCCSNAAEVISLVPKNEVRAFAVPGQRREVLGARFVAASVRASSRRLGSDFFCRAWGGTEASVRHSRAIVSSFPTLCLTSLPPTRQAR